VSLGVVVDVRCLDRPSDMAFGVVFDVRCLERPSDMAFGVVVDLRCVEGPSDLAFGVVFGCVLFGHDALLGLAGPGWARCFADIRQSALPWTAVSVVQATT
jgi:hypothetical protein